jgi:2-polyprenyl-3-methyl-5-hydroxy-6-metoxy-1,4-benzoquinol methylase
MIAPDAAACIACGGNAFTNVDYPALGAAVGTIRFDSIRICAACGLGRALPHYPQSTLDVFYADGDYWGGSVGRDARQALHERNQCRHRVDIALPFVSVSGTIRALDVGAGHGWIADWLVHALRGRALNYEYVEPDDRMSAQIEQRVTGAKLRRLRGWEEGGSSYDLIFLNHVLEHVADPLDMLAQVKRRLAPEAVAYIEVPNSDYRFKQNVFPHTCFFTPGAISRLGARAGLAVIDCTVFGHQPAGLPTLPLRAAYRIAATAGLPTLAGWIDDRLWHYRSAHDGMWIRCLISAAA